MGNIQLSSIRVGFNNAGKEMYYELSAANPDILGGLTSFLTEMNQNGIVLSKNAFNRILKDMQCTAYKGDGSDPAFQNTLIKKTPEMKKVSLEESFQNLCTFMNEHHLKLSPETQKALTKELGLTFKPHKEEHTPPPSQPSEL